MLHIYTISTSKVSEYWRLSNRMDKIYDKLINIWTDAVHFLCPFKSIHGVQENKYQFHVLSAPSMTGIYKWWSSVVNRKGAYAVTMLLTLCVKLNRNVTNNNT